MAAAPTRYGFDVPQGTRFSVCSPAPARPLTRIATERFSNAHVAQTGANARLRPAVSAFVEAQAVG